MARGGVVLCANVGAVANQGLVQWVGGRTSLVLIASTFPTTLNLQLQGPDGSTYINVNSANLAANGIYNFDLPAGSYRMNLVGGAVAGLYASLISIPYN